MIINKKYLFLLLIASFSCNNNYTPKPIGYFRIDFPAKEYRSYESEFPYAFEYPAYCNIQTYNADSAWINLTFPGHKATVYITYKKISGNYAVYLEETRNFVYKHTYKADAISEKPYYNYKDHVYGMLYDIKGNAASPMNFFVTDSTKHFLRGALYFNISPNKDSLAPVVDFIREDIIHLIETFHWK